MIGFNLLRKDVLKESKEWSGWWVDFRNFLIYKKKKPGDIR